jgi:hypothetical protein
MCALREVQLPLVAALLFCGSIAKLMQLIRTGTVDAGLGPAVLVPTRLRWPMAIAVCATECAIAVGLIVTAGRPGEGSPATAVRLAAALLFVVATCALIELWASHADVGCGCFGDFSTTPVNARTIVRSALLAVASLSTIWLPHITMPKPSDVPALVIAGVSELVLLGVLSPEIGQALIRLGYSEPCELHDVPLERTTSALHRSKQWRQVSSGITAAGPADVWRELCWRYLVYPTSYAEGQADVVFAVSLRQRRPTVRFALVHRSSGQPLPSPTSSARGGRRAANVLLPPASVSPALASTAHSSAGADLPLSTDL